MNRIFTGKLRKVFRHLAATVLLAVLSIGITLATNYFSRVTEERITIQLENVPFESALREIGKTARVKFVYSLNTLNVDKERINVDVVNQPLGKLLDDILRPLKMSFNVYEEERSITLIKNSSLQSEGRINPVSIPTQEAAVLELLVSGLVVDQFTKSPIAGANVIIKGTTNGTTTDQDGRFRIEANGSDRLVISFIGYKSREIEIGVQTELNIELSEDVSSLQEVVVNAGYYKVNQKEQTGNIQRISREDISKQPVSNPLNALTGRMTGVYVQQKTGVPGGGISIQIRGQNSLRNNVSDNGNLPLYIVDGVPFTSTSLTTSSSSNLSYGSPLSAINPADIESIEVLKDADATAIYGSRGANGVVLITTTKGSSGQPQITFNHAEGFGTISRKMPLLNTAQYIKMRKDAFRSDGTTPLLSNAPDLLAWDTTRYTDWQKILIGGTARTSTTTAGISGGNENTRMQLSLTRYRESTVFPGDYMYKKFAGHSFLSHASDNKKLTLDLTTNYVFENNLAPTGDLTFQAINLQPNAPKIYNDDGSLNWENSTWTNPMASILRTYRARTSNFMASSNVSYRLLDELTLKTSIGFTSVNVSETSLTPIASVNPGFSVRTGNAAHGINKIATWITEPQADYQKQIGPSLLKMMVGATFQENIREGMTVVGSGYTSDLLLENIQSAPQVATGNVSYVQYRYNAFFGRINYSLKERYLLNVTGRRDGSSRFGPQKRFANFAAIGTAWIFSEEEFTKSLLPALSHGKLRASFGVTGSDQISDYNYLDTYTTSGSYAGTTAINPSRLANPSYSWETNRKGEIGLEFGFLKDRLNLNVSAYRNISSNQLVGFPVAPTAGFTSVQSNLPAKVENKGLELEIQSVNVSTNILEWRTSLNLTIPRNVLLEYPGIERSSYANTYMVGEPLSHRKYFQYTGIDPVTGRYSFLDRTGDGALVRADDWVAVENGQRFFGGMVNHLKYHSFELDFIFQYVSQRAENYIRFFDAPGTSSSSGANQPAVVADYWRADRTDASVQIPTASASSAAYTAYGRLQNSTEAVSDASFLRLRTVSASYTFPGKWMTKAKVKSLKIYVQGQNLMTFTKYLGWDPESLSPLSLPPLRMFNAGIQLSF